jgi:mono/diheme cytochrome c family protein
MKRRWIAALAVVLVLIVGAGLFFFLPASLSPAQASAAQPSGAALVEKGRYLTTAGDCVACHTAPGGKPFAGGLAFKLPFGTIYASNITPDKTAGIGGWSDAEFVRAMRHGVRNDGRDLYPAFPYTAYAKLSTDDILAIRAYLATLAPVAQPVTPNGLSFPFNQRYLMRAWKLLFLSDTPMTPEPARSTEWNRGAYLVEALAHCGECHTPRNLMYGLKSGQKFAGATTQGWKAYNITADPHAGIGSWSADEIAIYLKTGHAEGRGVANGSMAEAVELSLSHLTPADLQAMAVYLKSVPAKPAQNGEIVDANASALAASTAYAPPPGASPRGDVGLRIFEGSCASCHGWNGQGLQNGYAALRGLKTVNDPQGTNLVQVILHGSHMATPQGQAMMPAFGAAYSDTEIAAVSNYVLRHFGNKTGAVTPTQVKDARSAGE